MARCAQYLSNNDECDEQRENTHAGYFEAFFEACKTLAWLCLGIRPRFFMLAPPMANPHVGCRPTARSTSILDAGFRKLIMVRRLDVYACPVRP